MVEFEEDLADKVTHRETDQFMKRLACVRDSFRFGNHLTVYTQNNKKQNTED